MRKLIAGISTILLISFSSLNLFGQFEELFKQNTLAFYQDLEDSINSELHLDDFEFGICRIPWKDPNCMKGIVRLKGDIYKRTNDDFPTGTYIWYFTYPNENVRHIKVNWGFYNNSSDLKPNEIIEICEGKEQSFIDKYEKTKELLINSILGEPTKKEENEDTDSRLLKKVKWDYKDKYVCLTLGYDRTAGKTLPDYFPINTSVEIDIYYKKDN